MTWIYLYSLNKSALFSISKKFRIENVFYFVFFGLFIYLFVSVDSINKSSTLIRKSDTTLSWMRCELRKQNVVSMCMKWEENRLLLRLPFCSSLT